MALLDFRKTAWCLITSGHSHSTALLLTALAIGMLLSFKAGLALAATERLQFTSNGHVLGFETGSMTAATSEHALRVEFVRAHAVSPHSTRPSPNQGKIARFLDRVTYAQLWDGVTLAYDRGAGILKSTYYIAPQSTRSTAVSQSDPVARIRLRYNAPVALDEDGNLVLRFKSGRMVESAPVAWQVISGRRVAVQTTFRLLNQREVGFQVLNYDPAIPLIIDPTLVWHTFMGSESVDEARAMAIDDDGNVYAAGSSNDAWGSPIQAYNGGKDAFAVKIDSSGNRLWHTFLGSDSSEEGLGIALDGSGNVYVAGTSSKTWGTPVNAHSGGINTFVAKLDSTGNRVWHTFVGTAGSSGSAIAVDTDGNAYIAGSSWDTWGTPMNAHTGITDGFAVKLDRNGKRVWNTFMGASSHEDFCNGIAIDSAGGVFVVGHSAETWGSPINDFNAGRDAFAVKLDNNGNRVWNTFIATPLDDAGVGTPLDDSGNGVALDSDGNLYVAGQGFFKARFPVIVNAYVSKLDSNGVQLWQVMLGGELENEWDSCEAIAVGGSTNIYVVGYSNNPWGDPIRDHTGNIDAFAAMLDANGTLMWNTFLGSTADDHGRAVAVTAGGTVYVAGVSETTWDVPVNPPSGSTDAFIASLSDQTDIDTDMDGVSDRDEQGPSSDDRSYDGNGDGTADWFQRRVISCPGYDGNRYATLAFTGDSMANATALAVDAPSTSPPAGTAFNSDFFDITLNGAHAGFKATMTIYLEDGERPNTYHHFGPTSTNTADHWYEFLYDGETGAQINDNVITVHFMDGGRGDDDMDAGNGMISATGGPGVAENNGGGSSGCFIAIMY